jgi:hypothetical protein
MLIVPLVLLLSFAAACGAKAPAIRGAYVHIPFCDYRCRYCNFVFETGWSPALLQKTLDAIVAEASRECRSTAEGLMAAVERERAVAVVGCEPSCMSAIRDDWTELRMGIDVAKLRALAAQSFLVEEFLEKRWDSHPARPAKPAFSPGPLALHAHCHQKALWGAESSAAILRRYFGADLEVLQTGCCGMAGSFGFTEERYDLSMKIAEQGVLPTKMSRERSVPK